MYLFKAKLTTTLGTAFAAVLFLGAVTPAQAAPPEGMRWSDTSAPYSTRRQSQSTRVGPTVRSPLFYSYPPVTMTPAVATPTTTSVRGPDGIVRTYPVEGPVVQQGAPAFVSVRGADGVVRMYPVAGSPSAVPVVTHPCR